LEFKSKLGPEKPKFREESRGGGVLKVCGYESYLTYPYGTYELFVINQFIYFTKRPRHFWKNASHVYKSMKII
jgi:hypothetical protein